MNPSLIPPPPPPGHAVSDNHSKTPKKQPPPLSVDDRSIRGHKTNTTRADIPTNTSDFTPQRDLGEATGGGRIDNGLWSPPGGGHVSLVTFTA